MIRFFHGLRHGLLNEGKTLAYLKYAIGELVLVVFGILIALQVNNWNEQRQLEAKADVALLEALQDLEQMVDRANVVIVSAEAKEVTLQRILAGKATEQDYRNSSDFAGVEFSLEEISSGISREGYDKLMRLADELPPGYTPALTALKAVYLRDAPMAIKDENSLADFVTSLLQHQSERYAWFSQGINDDYLAYALHDPLHRNDIFSYRTYSSVNYLKTVRQLKYQAMLAYQVVHASVDGDAPVPAAMMEVKWMPEARLRRFEGRYRRPTAEGADASIVSISLRNGQLWMNGGPHRVCNVFMTSEDGFSCMLLGIMNIRYRFTRDGHGEITGFDVLNGDEVKNHLSRLTEQ